MTTNFVALYRGRTVSDAKLVAVSAEPHLVRQFIRELLSEAGEDEKQDEPVLEVVRGDED